jgi:hypothetical protein
MVEVGDVAVLGHASCSDTRGDAATCAGGDYASRDVLEALRIKRWFAELPVNLMSKSVFCFMRVEAEDVTKRVTERWRQSSSPGLLDVRKVRQVEAGGRRHSFTHSSD